jgi:RNA polymerase sigma factor (sigma-70 family)
MAVGQFNKVLDHVRAVLERQNAAGMLDADLLKRYVQGRDEAAFAALVHRHGPMVLGVCRRVLHNLHDAEDAFQATFLVLVRKAASLRSPAMIGNWLYGVAYRTALHARDLAVKRRAKEAEMASRTGAADDNTWAGLRLALDQELERLPEKYRAAIVLCDLEGKTRKEAARLLGWAEGTVASRLVRGRGLLAKRLAHHGWTWSGGALATVLAQNVGCATVPASLVSSTIHTASLITAGEAAVGGISAHVAALAEGAIKVMFLTKLKISTAVVIVAVTAAVGAGVVLSQAPATSTDKDGAPGYHDLAQVRRPAPRTKQDFDKLLEDLEKSQGGGIVVDMTKDLQIALLKQAVQFYRKTASQQLVVVLRANQNADFKRVFKVIQAVTALEYTKVEAEITSQVEMLTALIRASSDTPYERVAKTMQVLRSAGVDKVLLEGPRHPDAELLQGNWKVKEAEALGKHLPRETSTKQTWAIKDGDIVVHFDDGVKENWTFTLDPTVTPRSIDLKVTAGVKAGASAKGIYKLEGNSLRICFNGHGERPSRFDAAALGASRWGRLFVLERSPVDPLGAYPPSDAFKANVAWHRKVRPNEIRLSWFLDGNPKVAMVCTADLTGCQVTTSREVHDWASQATETRKLSHAQVTTLGKLIKRLPLSSKAPDLKNLILVSTSEDGQPRTCLYDRLNPPRDVIRLYDLTGARLDFGRSEKE